MKYSLTQKEDSNFSAWGYMPQLDSLRALAAFGVFTQHFLDHDNLIQNTFRLGDLGVRLFFVLSGFLITGLLLDVRKKMNHVAISRATAILYFYVRRFLRLSPIYYFVILVLAIYMIPEKWTQPWWFFAYMQNFLFALENKFTVADHFWTLAVEEQFYLFWPFIVLFVPRPYLPMVMVSFVLTGPMFRILSLVVGLSHFQGSMLMPSHLDTFALGGLLAVLWLSKQTHKRELHRRLNIGMGMGLILLIIVLLSKILKAPSSIEFVLGELGAGLVFVWIIHHAATGFSGFLGYLLGHPILVYLGRISYGMYVFHGFVPELFAKVEWLGFASNFLHNEWIRFLIFSATSILLAWLSWHIIEKHANQLKRKFSIKNLEAAVLSK